MNDLPHGASGAATHAEEMRRDAARIEAELTYTDVGTDPFVAAVRATRMPMIITNPRLPDNPVVFVNNAFCRLTGYTRAEILGRNCRFLQGPDTDPETVKRLHDAVATPEPIEVDIRNYRKNGDAFWNRLLLAPVRGGDDRVAYFFASQVDVTLERERLEGLQSHNSALLAELAGRLHAQRDSEARLRFAAAAGRMGIWDLDLASGVLEASAVCRSNFGFGPDEPFSYADLKAAIHPEDRAHMSGTLERALATGRDYDIEYRVLKRSGAVGWVQVRAQVVRDAVGAAVSMAGISLDITERKAAETYRLALVELGDTIRDTDDPADLAVAAAGILGRSLGCEHVGYGIVDPETGALVEAHEWRAADAGGPASLGDHAVWLADLRRGEPMAVADTGADPRAAALAEAGIRSAMLVPLRESGSLVALLSVGSVVARTWAEDDLGFVRDMAERIRVAAERRRVEGELRRFAVSLERLVEERTAERDQVWRNSRDVIVILGEEARLRALNPAWMSVLGYTAAESLGRPMLDFVWPEDADLARQGFAIGAAGQPAPFELRHRDRSGAPRWISWHTSAENGRVYAYGRHVTAEKQQAEALRQAEDHLRQSQKMEAVGQLTGGLAHDFNNLLTGIGGSLELLQTRIAQGRLEQVHRYVAAAQDAARRAAALTHRLLAFSRRQTLDPRPTGVNRLIRDMEDLIRRTMGPEIEVEVVGAAGLWPALVDPNQLENALLNLCINARDAMPNGGRLTIETANRWFDERTARERDLKPGQYLSLCVSDTGTGMTPDVMERAFDPFFTTKPLGMGTGLGLSMIYGFARQSGGLARIYSELDKGTMVCLYLPRHYGPEDGPPASPSPGGRRQARRGETVLVVDDEASVRMLVTDVLAELGYETIEAGTGAEGLKVLESDACIDLLITDVGLPGGMNGRQMADAARALRPRLKILFITGYAENAAIGNGLLDPGMQVLTKPFGMEDLANRIRDLIA